MTSITRADVSLGYDDPEPDYLMRMSDSDKLNIIKAVSDLYTAEKTNPGRKRSVPEQTAVDLSHGFWDDRLYVVVYSVGQGYGGPEEGGWWYPTYTLEESLLVQSGDWTMTLVKAEFARRHKRQEWSAKEHGTYGYTSGWALYEVDLELVPQDVEPGKKERMPRPRYC